MQNDNNKRRVGKKIYVLKGKRILKMSFSSVAVGAIILPTLKEFIIFAVEYRR
jgi:hypothetical protein